MSSSRYTLKNLAEEAKKRAVVLLICVFGLSYLMSLTSSSVWINLPFATCLIILLRYLSLDFDIKRKDVMRINGQRDTITDEALIQRRASVELHAFSHKKPEKIDWRKKVNSPPVEAAIEKFTRHIISEWVTDLWYSRITPDKEGPEELVNLVYSVLGEVANRARDVNLINLLTRDIVNLICEHLELYRLCQSQIGKEQFLSLPPDQRDSQLKSSLESEKKLHPALFSAASEHKVLQQLTSGLLSITLRPEDLSCSFFRHTARELLACVVLRPIINLINPRFINERIEGLVIMLANRAALKRAVAQGNLSGPPPMPSADQLYAAMDKSSPGLELVQLRLDQSKSSPPAQAAKDVPKNNLVSHESLPSDSDKKSKNVEPRGSDDQWAQVRDQMPKQKSEILEPEHFENVWSKGRDYKKKEYHIISSGVNSNNFIKAPTSVTSTINARPLNRGGMMSQQERKFHPIYEESVSSDTSEEEENEIENAESENGNGNGKMRESNSMMGLDTPGIRVWESKSKSKHRGNATVASSQIHHPLESSEMQKKKRNKKNQSRKLRKRSRPCVPNLWQQAERGSLLPGDGHDTQNSPRNDLSFGEEYFDYDELENGLGRALSGMGASCSLSSFSSSISSYSSSSGYSANNVLADSFIKLKSEVIGANIVKSGSGMFAVYSVAVTDGNGNSWSIKRRFRHFEELHRRLKEFPEYNLSLPPKHFLSSGLEVSVVRERCKLLDTYLKKLLQIPTISGSIEAWDFLSVDSQTYIFSDSLSIVQALSVNLDDKIYDRKNPTSLAQASNPMGNLFSIAETSITNKEETAPVNQMYHQAGGGLRLRKANDTHKKCSSTYRDNAGSDSDSTVQTDFSFSIKSVPAETEHASYSAQIDEDDDDTINPDKWTPPNLTVPVLNLVNVIFQVQDGGWIRRQAFWVAKQLLQLGMGDAFDDWLIDKIQLLRKGPVIASGIQRIEQILWPDGIFLTKHPKRRPPAQTSQIGQNNSSNQPILTPEQQLEAARRAKFVHELMIEKAPTALVSLVGRKEYDRGAQDVYMFLQSPVCLNQLAYDLLELLLLATFPELDGVVRQIHEQK